MNFGCNFCEQFQYNISLITGWNYYYYGVVCMRDIPAGHLKHLRSERILTARSELASKLAGFGSALSHASPFKIHYSILPARRPSQLCLACTLM